MATDSLRKDQIKKFIEERSGKGYEKGQSQPFWIDLLRKVLGVENPTQFIEFEDHVKIDKANGFIDGFIPSTKVLIEQKSKDRNLKEAIRQSDGSLLNPFQQAKRYSSELPYDKRPRWIITCNFQSFLVYDMNNPNSEPEEILLKDLVKEYYRLGFIVNEKADHLKKEEELSFTAGDLIGKIYDAFSKQYKDLNNKESQRSLNELCVRLVFCLYAEDAGIFGKKDMFHDYLIKYENDLHAMRKALIELFNILDTKDENRDVYISEDLAQFPYVNGGLFSNENIEIPNFTEEIKNLILVEASDRFDRSEISPTIFGAVFESTLNPETRRKGGMHYTSIENIHKVIDPLFLNDLRDELDKALEYKRDSDRKKALLDFQNHISSLKFFDPACGSGNFLTETYLSLRRLENEAIRAFGNDQIALDPSWIIKVHINQFYGIEINDFAVTVARTALWIAESQTIKETEEIINGNINFLPLKSYTNIREGNALRIDWNNVISNKECNYVMGNPPFVGARLMEQSQKDEINEIFKGVKNVGNLDYVAGWYKLATNYMKGTKIQTALVSTNSITQGEQVGILWKDLFDDGILINFAHRTFRWDSESNSKAHVHCVIIGFSFVKDKYQYIFDNGIVTVAKNINGYLVDGPLIAIESRTKPLCDVPEIGIGNQPIDGGNYLFTEEEKNEFIKKEPKSEKYFKRWMGAEEFINNKNKYCLWLGDCSSQEIKNMPLCYERVKNVREFRLKSKRGSTLKLADSPTHFQTENMPKSNFIILPETSSERRKYMPLGFQTPNTLCSNAVRIAPNTTIYHFGILISNVHMAWLRTVGGRLKSDYRYSKDIVYNNFPRPNSTDEQKKKIETTAFEILKARNLYPNSSLADLYDETLMPKELRKAHQDNDRAVMEAYGFDWKTMTESECVAELMIMYIKLVEQK